MKSKRVLVPKETNETIFHSELTPSHKVSVITGITANGKVLKSAVISKRKDEDEYGSNCPYFKRILHFSSPKSFVTRKIFESYLQQCIYPYIEKVRLNLNCSNKTALILFDGCKAHLGDVLSAWAATKNIFVVVIPPHSSHLVQALDQGFLENSNPNTVMQRITQE